MNLRNSSLVLGLLFFSCAASAQQTCSNLRTLDFEGFPEGSPVSSQYTGVGISAIHGLTGAPLFAGIFDSNSAVGGNVDFESMKKLVTPNTFFGGLGQPGGDGTCSVDGVGTGCGNETPQNNVLYVNADGSLTNGLYTSIHQEQLRPNKLVFDFDCPVKILNFKIIDLDETEVEQVPLPEKAPQVVGFPTFPGIDDEWVQFFTPCVNENQNPIEYCYFGDNSKKMIDVSAQPDSVVRMWVWSPGAIALDDVQFCDCDRDCAGIPDGPNILDDCGVCVLPEDANQTKDECGVCGGDGTSCACVETDNSNLTIEIDSNSNSILKLTNTVIRRAKKLGAYSASKAKKSRNAAFDDFEAIWVGVSVDLPKVDFACGELVTECLSVETAPVLDDVNARNDNQVKRAKQAKKAIDKLLGVSDQKAAGILKRISKYQAAAELAVEAYPDQITECVLP